MAVTYNQSCALSWIFKRYGTAPYRKQLKVMQYHFPEFLDIGLSNSAMYPDQATHTLAALEYHFVAELTKYSCGSVSSRLGLTSTISTITKPGVPMILVGLTI